MQLEIKRTTVYGNYRKWVEKDQEMSNVRAIRMGKQNRFKHQVLQI